jgi:flagellar motor protein MotB
MTRLPRKALDFACSLCEVRACCLWACLSLAALALTVAGCADNPMVLSGKLKQAETDNAKLASQNQELQRRVDAAARDNQQLHENLAREQQQTAISDKLQLEKSKQLQEVAAQLAQTREEKERSEKRAQILSASMQRQGGVTISPNSTSLPEIRIPGVQVRRDSDVIRIELPNDRLFDGGNRLRADAGNWITSVAAEIARNYPDQLIGVEGNTDNDPRLGSQGQEISVMQATAVYKVLADRTRLQANQLVVVGRGATNPIVSNGTPAGRQRNRRVEIVIYPERKPSEAR